MPHCVWPGRRGSQSASGHWQLMVAQMRLASSETSQAPLQVAAG